MADQKRDVEFIIRARDLSSRTFREVSGAVNGLTQSLDQQIAKAEKAEISANELKNTYRQLDQAGRALISQQGLIDYYRRISDNLDAATQKAQTARRAQQDFAASLEGVENRTKAQEKQLTALTRAADAADKKAATLRGNLESQSEKLRQAGLDTDNLAGSQRQLVAAAQQVGDALIKTQGALDGYDANVRRVKQANVEAAAAYQAFEARVRAGVLAMKAEDARTAAADKEAQAQAVREAAHAYELFEAKVRAGAAAMKDQDALTAFRQIGVTAEQNAQKIAASNAQASAAGDTVAARLLRIVDPAKAAGESLDTLTAEVNRLDAVVGAADQPLREYQDAIYDLGQAQRSILSQAKVIDDFRQQEAAVEAATRQVDAARAEVLQYAAAVQAADTPNRELVSSLRQAEAALAAENRELDNQNRKLAVMSGNLQRAGVDARNLAAAERQLEQASKTSANALQRLNDAAAGKNSKAGRFLGLRPYELTNLSYQINDIFTQIASGTSVTQTLAQQGGQIVQIFPRAFGAMAAFIPELAAVAAVLVAVGAAAKNISDEAASTRQFAGALALTADEGEYSAEALAATAHELDVFGGSLEDARKEIGIFLNAGLDPTMIERFGKSAQNLSDVTGKDLPESAKLLADGFSGGFEQVAKLDDALNFLTAAEREQIKAMFDSGDAAGARTRAFEIFEAQADRAAEKSRSSWGEALKALTRIWDDLLKGIGNSKPMQEAIDWLDRLADAAERWANSSAGGGGPRVDGAAGGSIGSRIRRAPDAQLFSQADINAGLVSPFATAIIGNPSFTRPGWAGGTGGRIELTDELRDVLAMVFLEAINNPQAQRDVFAVIANRATRSGMTGSQVVRAPGQFEPFSARRAEFDRTRMDDATLRRVLANVLPVLEGSVADPTRGATMFVSPGGQAANGRAMPSWADPAKMTLNRYGHQFFLGRFPGDRGSGDTINTQSQAAEKAGAEALDKMREEIALRDKSNHALRLEVAERDARRKIQEAGGTPTQENEAGALARAAEQKKINDEIAKEAEQQARRTEAEQRRVASAIDTLRSDLRGLESRAQRVQDASLDARLAAIDTQFSGIEQNLKEAEALGVKQVDGLSLADYRARVAAGKDILKQQETMAFFEDQIKNLEEQRVARLRQIADDAAAGVISSDEAFRQAQIVIDDLAPKIAAMAADAWEFGQAIRTAEPNAQLDAFVAQASRTNAREMRPGGTNTPLAGIGREQLTAGQAELNAIIQQRNELVANYARLVELGTLRQDEARQKTAEAYAATQPLIEAQVGEIIRLITAMQAAGSITAAEFDRIRVALEVTSEEAVYVDANFLRLRNTIVDGLASGATTALNGISESLAGLADGSLTAEEALNGIWDSARTGLADFLSGIADVIMQMAVMQAVEGLPFLDGMTSQVMDVAGLTATATTLSAASTTLAAAGTTVSGGAAAVTGASAALSGAAAGLTAAGGAAGAAAIPLSAAAAALSAAAAAMTTAASLQIAANATGGGIFHSGGVVGSSVSGVSRNVSSLAWTGAPRYHSGGLIGLSSDEHAAILQRGEEVLKKNDPRNILNGGAAAGGSSPVVVPPAQVKVVNALDAGQIATEMMDTQEGEQALLNFMGRRPRQIKERLGIS